MSRYQGLVALEGGSLEDAAHEYFLRSEQIPTRVRLAVGEELARRRRRPETSLARRRHAAAVPAEGAGARAAGRSRSRRCAGRRASPHAVAEDDAWVEGRVADRDRRGYRTDRSGPVERAAALSAVSRARRARVLAAADVRAQCSCSRDAVSAMLKSFSPDDRAHMVEDGKVVGDLRVLLVGLSIHPARSGRGGVGRPRGIHVRDARRRRTIRTNTTASADVTVYIMNALR